MKTQFHTTILQATSLINLAIKHNIYTGAILWYLIENHISDFNKLSKEDIEKYQKRYIESQLEIDNKVSRYRLHQEMEIDWKQSIEIKKQYKDKNQNEQ